MEKLRIALDVAKGMRHLVERKVSWRYGEGQKVMFNSSKYYLDSELNWTGQYSGLDWTYEIVDSLEGGGGGVVIFGRGIVKTSNCCNWWNH